MDKRTAIVIGAGIVGLATARALARKGFSVQVFDRTHKAVGASIRNFGMIWPIGQPGGGLYERAIRSRCVWQEIAEESNIWFDAVGSLHLAYHQDEWHIMQELFEEFSGQGRKVQLLDKRGVAEKSEAACMDNLYGGLFSEEEMIVDPREAIACLPSYFSEKWKIQFHWGKCVSYISNQTVYIGNDEEFEADLVFVCNGADFETLYPEFFNEYPLTKCKLQMMRLATQPENWRIGPALCGGLSLIHYNSFKVAPSLSTLRKRFEEEMSDYIEWGIHVMVSQNGRGELTVGDSHEYGMTHDPFDKKFINELILSYLKRFARFKDWTVAETWSGIYPKLTDGETNLFFSPEPGVYIINAVGGAGMTLSFGLAEELIGAI
ncbi:MAG: TIGR03364 family FAD-dependent oxidoreductase [Bacteroidetes bacterium]|nr:MAG: TIGR03364 family FAD-dependent oxidoreductase [Bacteroidota bacterium]